MIFLRFARRFTGPAAASTALLWGSAWLFALALGFLEVSSTALFLAHVEWASLAWVWIVAAALSLGGACLNQVYGEGQQLPARPAGWLSHAGRPIERFLKTIQSGLLIGLPPWLWMPRGMSLMVGCVGSVWLWLCLSPHSVFQSIGLPGSSSLFFEAMAMGTTPQLSQVQAVLLQGSLLALLHSVRARLWRGEYWLLGTRSPSWPLSAAHSDVHLLDDVSHAHPTAIPLSWMMACGNLGIALMYLGWLLWQTVDGAALGASQAFLSLTPVLALEWLLVGSAISVLLAGCLLWSQRYQGGAVRVGQMTMSEAAGANPSPPVLVKYARALLVVLLIGRGLTLLLQWGLWGEIQNIEAIAPPSVQLGILTVAGSLALLRGAWSLVGLTVRALRAAGGLVRHGTFPALAWLPLAGLGLCLLMVQNIVPRVWGVMLLWGLDGLLEQSLRRYAQERLLRLLPNDFLTQLLQQFRLGSHWLMAFLAGLLILDVAWMGQSPSVFLLALAGAALVLLVTLAFLRYRYFQLIFAAIDQFALQHGSAPDSPSEAGLVEGLLRQSDNPLVKRALLRSFKRSLGAAESSSEYSLACLCLLEQIDLQLTSATLAPLLLRLPPLLQLESLAVMTRAEQQRRHQHQRGASLPPSLYLRNVAALMTPLASPAVFAAALRFQFYGSSQIIPQQLKMYMHAEYPLAVRALAASFALREGKLVAAQGGMDEQWMALRTSAKQQLKGMLSSRSEEERLLASRCLLDLTDLSPVQDRIPALLEDFSSEVREVALKAIGQTQCRPLYPRLLKALQSPRTEQPARQALFSLGQDAIPLLQCCTQHPDISLPTKMSCWQIMTQLQGASACQALSEDLMHQGGAARQLLLKLMLTQSRGHGAIAKRLAAAEGVALLLKEELWLLSHLYVALADLNPQLLPGNAVIQLGQALRQQQRDVGERLLLLLQIRYPAGGLGRVAQQLRDPAMVEKGLAQLRQVVDSEFQPLLMVLFDASSLSQKRLALAAWSHGDRLPAAERLQLLLSMPIGLEAWPLACAYELALEQEIPLSDESLLVGIHHQEAGVRSAVQAYLNCMSTDLVADFLGAAAE